MTVSLSQQQIDTLYPAHIFVDPLLQITGLGPSLRRRAPWLTIGSPLFAHFRSATGQEVRDLEPLARNSTAIVLAAREHRLMLAGIALHLAEGYLLTLNHVPSGDEIDLEVSDFAPGDPHLSNLLLIRVQNALIEESSAVASELTLERQRVVDVIDRVGRMSGYLAHDLNNFLSVISLNASVCSAPKCATNASVIAWTLLWKRPNAAPNSPKG